jgi:hypothetical protein
MKLTKKQKIALSFLLVTLAFLPLPFIYDWWINYTPQGFLWNLQVKGYPYAGEQWTSNVPVKISNRNYTEITEIIPVDTDRIEVESITRFLEIRDDQSAYIFGPVDHYEHGAELLIYSETVKTWHQHLTLWFSNGTKIFYWDNWRGNN